MKQTPLVVKSTVTRGSWCIFTAQKHTVPDDPDLGSHEARTKPWQLWSVLATMPEHRANVIILHILYILNKQVMRLGELGRKPGFPKCESAGFKTEAHLNVITCIPVKLFLFKAKRLPSSDNIEDHFPCMFFCIDCFCITSLFSELLHLSCPFSYWTLT